MFLFGGDMVFNVVVGMECSYGKPQKLDHCILGPVGGWWGKLFFDVIVGWASLHEVFDALGMWRASSCFSCRVEALIWSPSYQTFNVNYGEVPWWEGKINEVEQKTIDAENYASDKPSSLLT